MGDRRPKRTYGGYPSWRAWRNAHAPALIEARVPTLALENERNWRFFLQEATVVPLGGPAFDASDLTRPQLMALRDLLIEIPESALGNGLVADIERAACDTCRGSVGTEHSKR